MNTYYIPVHYYEQESENDDLVMLITNKDIDDANMRKYLENSKIRHIKKQDEYSDQNEMVDAIFNELAEILSGVWCYCKTLPQLIIGDD